MGMTDKEDVAILREKGRPLKSETHAGCKDDGTTLGRAVERSNADLLPPPETKMSYRCSLIGLGPASQYRPGLPRLLKQGTARKYNAPACHFSDQTPASVRDRTPSSISDRGTQPRRA